MIAAVRTAPLFTDKAEAARIIATPFQRFAHSFFLLPLGRALVVIVTFFQIPNGRPAVMGHVCLIFRMQRLQQFRRLATNGVVIGGKVS